MTARRILLDTNIITRILRGGSKLHKQLEHHELYVSSITRVELLAWDQVDPEDELWLQAFLERCELVRVNRGIEDAGAALIRRYGLSLPDALIAATAITEGLWFMSEDKAFKRIKKGLKLIHYLP